MGRQQVPTDNRRSRRGTPCSRAPTAPLGRPGLLLTDIAGACRARGKGQRKGCRRFQVFPEECRRLQATDAVCASPGRAIAGWVAAGGQRQQRKRLTPSLTYAADLLHHGCNQDPRRNEGEGAREWQGRSCGPTCQGLPLPQRAQQSRLTVMHNIWLVISAAALIRLITGVLAWKHKGVTASSSSLGVVPARPLPPLPRTVNHRVLSHHSGSLVMPVSAARQQLAEQQQGAPTCSPPHTWRAT